MHKYTSDRIKMRPGPEPNQRWRRRRGGGAPASGLVEEAAPGARVAGRPGRLHPEQDRVRVAVEPALHNLHVVARGGALLPQPAGAGVEPGAAALPGLRPRFGVHPGQHQHLARGGVLHHGGQEAPREIRFTHSLTSRPAAASPSFTCRMLSSPKWKMDAASAASAPPAVRAWRMCSALPAPPEAITGRRTAPLTALRSSTS